MTVLVLQETRQERKKERILQFKANDKREPHADESGSPGNEFNNSVSSVWCRRQYMAILNSKRQVALAAKF